MYNFVEGEILLVDKPLEWTSFDIVNKLRYHLKRVSGQKKLKVGHAGTLDPLATGLLIVCTGRKTKTIHEIQGQQKEYTGIITLGATTASYDLETEQEDFKEYKHIKEQTILEMALKLSGKLEQFPPIYSAKKIDGKRAYQLARKGKIPEMKSKEITVYSFDIEKIELPDIHFRIKCSTGTYIRSIAHDFGKLLGVGAHLKALRRTLIGEYKVEDALDITKLDSIIPLENT